MEKDLAGTTVRFVWSIDPESDVQRANATADQIADRLRQTGGKVHVQPAPEIVGILPILVAIPVIIAGAVEAVALVEQVYGWWTNRNRPGLIIQVTKSGHVDVRDTRSIAPRHVLYIDPDGKATVLDVSDSQLKELLEAVSKGADAALSVVEKILTAQSKSNGTKTPAQAG